MMLPLMIAALLLQSGKASVAGVAVHASTGQPVANIRVTLARTDAPPIPAIAELMSQDPPPIEMTLPGEMLLEISREIAASGGPGATPGAPPPPPSGVREFIVSPDGAVAIVSDAVPPTRTDGEGRFVFTDVDPGAYRLFFAGNGYTRQDYGQRVSGGRSTPIALTAGQAKNDIVMRMTPAAAVSGRIFDKAGQPIAGVPVELLRFAYDRTGRKLTQRFGSTQTDDRGEYRIYFLSPGRYYLNAGMQQGPSRTILPNTPTMSTNRISENYALTYYPGVTDLAVATVIDVQPGADLSGIDLFLSKQQSYRIRGRIVDGRTGQPPPSASISLSFQRDNGERGSSISGSNYNPASGSFELRDVMPGSYTVTAGSTGGAPLVQTLRATAYANVKVVNSDVDGILLTTATGNTISGRVRMDSSAPSAAAPFDRLSVQLRPSADGAPTTSINTPTPETQSISADGAFSVVNVLSGEYRVSVLGLPRGFYLKDARLGESDVLSRPLQFSGPDSSALEILISPNVAQIDGVATNEGGRPVPGAQVVLIPVQRREESDLFRSAFAGLDGHFTIPNVTPGDYNLVAWESLEPFAFFDPELLKQADQKGKSLHIAESSKQTVEIGIIQ